MTDTKDTNPKDALGVKKAPLHCIPCGPLYELGLAMMEGGRKYGTHNYRAVGVRASVYYDAIMRHITQWWEGEDIDFDSGLHPLIKAAASIVVMRDGMLMNNYIDDRPIKYPDGLNMSKLNKKAGDIIEKHPGYVAPYLEKDEKQRDDTESEKYGKFTIRKAQDARKGWYIIVTKSAGQGCCSKFLHKDLEIYPITGWAPHFDYGKADGYYDNRLLARSYIRMYESKPFVCPEGWVIEFNEIGPHRAGWYVHNRNTFKCLHKDLTLHATTGYGSYDFGEAPGYWPTKQEAEAALTAYLRKEQK